MKRTLLFALLTLFLFSCAPQEKKESHDMQENEPKAACCEVKDGLFMHISSGYDNPHKVLMALKMALMMSMDKMVVVYIDIEGVKMVLKDSKDMTFADFPPLKELLNKLIEAKVPVMACPTCLKIAGKTEADLMPGVILADKEKFFNFTKGRIVTLDY